MLIIVVAGVAVLVLGYVGLAVHGARTEQREKTEAFEGARGKSVFVGFEDGERNMRVLGLTDDGRAVRLQEGREEITVPLTMVRSFRRSLKETPNRW